MIRICSNKKYLAGSSKLYFKGLGVVLANLQYKKFAIIFLHKQFNIDDNICTNSKKKTFNKKVNYAKKGFGQNIH